MKIAIIGASSGIGLLTTQQALRKGHTVTALARSEIPLPDHPLLTKIQGNATAPQDLQKAVQQAEAILITIGTKKKNAGTLFTDTARALLSLPDSIKVPILWVTGFGTGTSKPYLSWWMKLVIHFFLRNEYEDKGQAEQHLQQSSLSWEIVRPGMLTNQDLNPSYRFYPQLEAGMRVGPISRASVADFLIKEAENPQFLYHAVALSN